MTTIRVAKRRRFTVISREALNDGTLSFRARGVLAWLLDKPDDWRCNSEEIAAEGKEGRDAIRQALKELEGAGYLRREKVQSSTGRWLTTTVIYESPTPENPSSVAGKPTPGKPDVGEPGPIPPLTVTKDCKERARSARRPSKPFPTDWKPSESEIASATRVGMTKTTRRVEFDNFRDHHLAKGSTMADWPAAWRTWCGNWVKFGAQQAPDPTNHDETLAHVLGLA